MLNKVLGAINLIVEKFYIAYYKRYFESFGKKAIVRRGTKIYGTNIIIGNYSRISNDCHLQTRGGIKIGELVMISPHVQIYTAGLDMSQRYDHNIDDIRDHVEAPVVIEDGVWVGAGSIILPGVILAKGSVVAAGSIVTKDVKTNCVYGGNPARFIKQFSY